MDFDLTAEQRMVVETVRAFVDRELVPHEEEVERTGEVSAEVAQGVRLRGRKLGLFSPNMPLELGGGGLDALTVALMECELGRTSYALHYLIPRPSDILLGCEGDQVATYLLPTVRGDRLECVAMTEPEAGSDVRSMRTTARRDGDDYVLDGTKHFISKADIADYVIVFAKTGIEDGPRGPRNRVSAFLVDKGTPGFVVRPGYESTGHRGYHNCVLEFTDCRVPAGQLLGREHEGFGSLSAWLMRTRLQVAAMCVGRGRRALELASAYAATRRQFDRPIGQFQGVSFKLADMAMELRAAELLTLHAAAKLARGSAEMADAAMVKVYATEMLGRLTDNALQIHGGMGVVRGMPIERFWRDARVERIWDGTSEVLRHLVARSLLRPLES